MGIRDLSKLIERFARKSSRPITLAEAQGTRWAVDANIFMYRFMAAKPHYDGRHVERFRRFVLWMQAHHIEPIFVFDGDSPDEKKRELKTRRDQKKKATSSLRDLQQGVVVLHHLDWRCTQLETVLHAMAQPRGGDDGNDDNDDADEQCDDTVLNGAVNQGEECFAFSALFQLIAEVLEWATETYLPTRLVQEHVDRSAFLHRLPIATLPSLVRFMAFVRLRRHTPHMVELDWMHDPALAALGIFDPAAGSCRSAIAETKTNGRADRASSPSAPSAQRGPVATGPIVLIGGGDIDDLRMSAETQSGHDDGVHRANIIAGSCSRRVSTNTCAVHEYNVAADSLERLIIEALASQRDASPQRKNEDCSEDRMPPFILCVHCARSVAERLSVTIAKYRRNVDKAWQVSQQYAMLVAVIVHDNAQSDGEWLLPTPAHAEKYVRAWQSSLRWPTKCQEKAANGANFDYFDWISSARSSAWWFDMQETSAACTDMRFCTDKPVNNAPTTSDLTAGSACWQNESLDGDALAHLLWSRLWPRDRESTQVTCDRKVCFNQCDLYTRAAATVLNRRLDEQGGDTKPKEVEVQKTHFNEPQSGEDRETAQMEKQWDSFRFEQQRRKGLLSAAAAAAAEAADTDCCLATIDAEIGKQSYQVDKDDAERSQQNEPVTVAGINNGGKNTCRPKKQRLLCLESPNHRSLLAKRMQKQIASLEPQVTRVTGEQLQQVQELLRSMSVLSLTAEHEAEATCARLCRAGFADWVVTEDFDALPFGAPHMLRRLRWTEAVLADENISLASHAPNGTDDVADKNNNATRRIDSNDVIGELVDFRKVLQQLRMTPIEFVDLCILCGCDFCASLSGVGFAAARDLILRYGCIENVVDRLHPSSRYGKGLRRFSVDGAQRARELFMDNHSNTLPEEVRLQIMALQH